MIRLPRSRWLLVLALVSPGAIAQQAGDTRSNVSLNGMLGYSDNIGRNDVNKIESTFYDIGAVIDWARTGTRYDISIASDLSYREFDEREFDSQLFGNFDANLDLYMVPDRLAWTFRNRLGQGRVNEFAPAAPNNRQNINNFATGPRLTLPAGRTGQFSADATYSKSQFEDANRADSDAVLYRLAYSRALSSTRNLGLEALQRTIEFDDELDSEFDINSYFLTFGSSAARGSFSAQLGFDRVSRRGNEDEGLRARINVSRQAGAYSSFNLGVGRQITDSGSLLGQSSGGDIFNRVNQIAAVNDALTRTDLRASFAVDRPRSRFDVSLGWIDDEFQTQSLNDVELYQFRSSIRRELSPRSSVTLGGQFLRRNFAFADQRNDEWRVTAGFRVRVGTRGSINSAYTRRRLHATSRFDFEENQYTISFSWAVSGTESR